MKREKCVGERGELMGWEGALPHKLTPTEKGGGRGKGGRMVRGVEGG